MDDQLAYLLNGLCARTYTLGRIMRFRRLQRGTQATTYELLTAGGREYTLAFWPARHSPLHISTMFDLFEALRSQQFPVPAPVRTTAGAWLADGPQGETMGLWQNVSGQHLALERWTGTMFSHLGLRLAWLHGLLAMMPLPLELQHQSLPQRLDAALTTLRTRQDAPWLHDAAWDRLAGELADCEPWPRGWIHGGMGPAALLWDDEQQVCCIVDALYHRGGHPLEDLLELTLIWQRLHHTLPESYRVLFEAYASMAALPQWPWDQVVSRWLLSQVELAAAGRKDPAPALAQQLAQRHHLAEWIRDLSGL